MMRCLALLLLDDGLLLLMLVEVRVLRLMDESLLLVKVLI